MKIFEVVIGSNQRLIQPQTVGKKEGAPMIWGDGLVRGGCGEAGGGTDEYAVQGLGIVRCR